MLRTTTAVLAVTLVGLVSGLDVYNGGDFGALGGRTSTAPRSEEPVYLPIDGLEPSQHGFRLISPSLSGRLNLDANGLSVAQIDTIRKQEEFYKSVQDTNNARRLQSTGGAGNREAVESGARISTTGFHTRTGGLTGQLRTNSPIQPSNNLGGFHSELSSRYQSGSSGLRTAGSIQEVHRPSYSFQDVQGVPFSSQRTRTKSVIQPLHKDSVHLPTEGSSFNANRESFITKSTGDQTTFTGDFKRRPSIVSPAPFQLAQQTGDDEESQFISQVNQNTAASVSAAQGERNFLPVLPQKPAISQRTKPLSNEHLNNEYNSRKTIGLKSRVRVEGEQYDGLLSAPVLPTGTQNQLSSRFQNKDESEEIIDHDLESRKQAESAKYSFVSDVSDTVNGNSQTREEVRDGLKLTGMYSYSDGFFKRTVHYQADENGYRIVKEENEPIGNGPQYDPNGEIQVKYSHAGSSLSYKIRGDQVKKPNRGRDSQLRTGTFSDQLELPS